MPRMDEEERQDRSNTGATTLTSCSCDDHECGWKLNRRIIIALVALLTAGVTAAGWVMS